MFFMAILATSCFGGWRAGLLATALGAMVVVYFFIEPLATPSLIGRLGGRFPAPSVRHLRAAVSLVADVMLVTRRQSERQARLLDHAHDAVFAWEFGGPIVYWNRGAERLYGIPPRQAVGRVASELLGIRSPDSLDAVLVVLMETGEWSGELTHTAANGDKIVVDCRMALIQEPDGRRLVLESNRDITQRKADEGALRESEERYRTVADHTYDWEYWLTPDGKLTYCSPSCERLTGYRSDEYGVDPTLLRRIVHPDDNALWHQHLLDDISRPETCTLDWRIITRQGETRWIAHVCTPVYTSDGRVLGRRASNRDITARKRVEQALHESHERFQRALESIPDVVVIYDRDLTIQYINNATRQLTGRPVTDYIGKRDEEVWPPEVYEVYLPTLREAFQTRAIRAIQTDVFLPGRGTRSLQITCVPLIDDEGGIREVLGITHDDTER